MAAETVFSKILRGAIPCARVYEDEHVLAFLDINPLSRGHTLVIPKEPVETLDQLSDDVAAAIGRVLPRLSRAILAATGASHFNILQNNGYLAHQAVRHVHFHIIPKLDSGAGLDVVWRAMPMAQSDADELAEAIVAKL